MSAFGTVAVFLLATCGIYFVATRVAAVVKWVFEFYDDVYRTYRATDIQKHQIADLQHRIHMIEVEIGKEEA